MSWTWVPHSKDKDSGSHKQKFLGFQIPDYLTWDESKGGFVGLGTGDYLSPGKGVGGGGEEGGGETRRNLADSSFECYFTEVIPLITFDDSRDFPPAMSSFSKEIWVVHPLNPSKVFSDPPFWALSYDWSLL